VDAMVAVGTPPVAAAAIAVVVVAGDDLRAEAALVVGRTTTTAIMNEKAIALGRYISPSGLAKRRSFSIYHRPKLRMNRSLIGADNLHSRPVHCFNFLKWFLSKY
jgi:hypothetical protein